MSDQIFQVNSSSFQDVEVSSSLRAAPTITIDFSQAANITGSFSGPGHRLTNLSASYIIVNSNTTSSWANTASFIQPLARISISDLTSSNAISIGPPTITASVLSISGSANVRLLEIDSNLGSPVFYVRGSGTTVITDGRITGSLQGTSSYALTSSYNASIVSTVSTTNASSSTLTGQNSVLSFTASVGETWICDANLICQSNNNRGLKHIISSSVASPGGTLDGWIWSPTNAITAQTMIRYQAFNTQGGTSVHTQANVPGPDGVHFIVTGLLTASVISIGISVTNIADTATLFADSYMIARRVQ